jgi:hypothetical protein
MASGLVIAVEIISALLTIILFYSTLKPCRASSVSYLLGIPAGFGLMAISSIVNVANLGLASSAPGIGLIVGFVQLLTGTYGLLFVALSYARRTRFRFIGASTSAELAIPSFITLVVLFYTIFLEGSASLNAVPANVELMLRTVIAIAALYLVYETERNWSLTKRGGEGVVIVGFALLFVEQIGFILASWNFGVVALFLGYEGRILGLIVLNAVTHISLRAGDTSTVLKRLGLEALAH